MLRIDHIAYRCADRHEASDFFIKAFGYRVQDHFPIDFGAGDTARCISLTPEFTPAEPLLPGLHLMPFTSAGDDFETTHYAHYHLPPEIFVSDGTPDSIVGRWVKARGGIGGVHHIAYECANVWSEMVRWKGLAEFTSEPIECPEEGLVQVFTTAHPITGVVYELISRKERGFCRASVAKLMRASENK
jgi:catechol 2,3-dioxygenase-like lactoylglutathione lyase family enzyme